MIAAFRANSTSTRKVCTSSTKRPATGATRPAMVAVPRRVVSALARPVAFQPRFSAVRQKVSTSTFVFSSFSMQKRNYVDFNDEASQKILSMDLKTKLNKDLVDAMKAKELRRVEIIRQIKSKVTYWEKENADKPIKDSDVLRILLEIVAESEDTIAEMAKYNNTTAIAKEQRTIDLVNSYLPPRANASQIDAELLALIKQLNATSLKDMGKLMAEAGAKMAGRATTKEISDAAKKLLTPSK